MAEERLRPERPFRLQEIGVGSPLVDQLGEGAPADELPRQGDERATHDDVGLGEVLFELSPKILVQESVGSAQETPVLADQFPHCQWDVCRHSRSPASGMARLQFSLAGRSVNDSNESFPKSADAK